MDIGGFLNCTLKNDGFEKKKKRRVFAATGTDCKSI